MFLLWKNSFALKFDLEVLFRGMRVSSYRFFAIFLRCSKSCSFIFSELGACKRFRLGGGGVFDFIVYEICGVLKPVEAFRLDRETAQKQEGS